MCASHIEMDQYRVNIMKPNNIETILSVLLKNRKSEPDLLMFDGLFLTNNDVVKAISDISENMISKDICYEIHCWNSDREALSSTCNFNNFNKK